VKNDMRGTGFSPAPSLIALIVGLSAGIFAHHFDVALLLALERVLAPFGQVWLSALQMTVLPLVITNLVTAVLANSENHIFGRTGIGALTLFVGYLILGAVFALAVGSPIIAQLPVSPETVTSFNALTDSASQAAAKVEAQPDFGGWLVSLIPTNPFEALASGHLLPVLLFTIAFAIAATRIEDGGRQALFGFFKGASETMMVLVNWILRATPIGVLALSLSIGSGVGAEAATALVQYLLLICVHLLAFTGLLYPLTAALGGVGLRFFATGVLPAQIVAIGTRSSLASLPALLEGAQEKLRLNTAVAEISLPRAVTMFKSNRTISSVLKLLFIAHLFAIDLSVGQIAAFLVTIMIVSFSAVGIPLGGGGMKSLPAYLAAGVPIEAYIMFKTVEAIPDIFKTLLNVTADMSVAVILNRWLKQPETIASVSTIQPTSQSPGS